MACKVAGLSQY